MVEEADADCYVCLHRAKEEEEVNEVMSSQVQFILKATRDITEGRRFTRRMEVSALSMHVGESSVGSAGRRVDRSVVVPCGAWPIRQVGRGDPEETGADGSRSVGGHGLGGLGRQGLRFDSALIRLEMKTC